MTKANRRNYDLAAALVESGQWRVDADAGIVYGKKGNPFAGTNGCGYTWIRFCDPDDWRKMCPVLAHRVIWEYVHGPIPEDREINHIDGNKMNNAIENLEAVTHAENARHAMRTGLTPIRRGQAVTSTVLTDAQALEIYARAWAGENRHSIAADFPIKACTVSNIKHGHAWRHLTGHPTGRRAYVDDFDRVS